MSSGPLLQTAQKRRESQAHINSSAFQINARFSIHAPPDCKQIPEDKRCTEEELDPSWGEEMKAAELTETARESHSSGHLESDGHANSETLNNRQAWAACGGPQKTRAPS
ncbi:zinc finger protein 184-like isoform X1 [Lates japonicus]|uniref:Zinc finger protein 184-like isoform X1 n=1 Tax=Lates japonicus TaxID=270547 RepID=A0AAD3RCB6_LATJO|nr:zinc finger protein 184-like isoform X1 [Lates japonicus]